MTKETKMTGGADQGWELIQFREAVLVGEDTWRLSGLLRGQRGSVPGVAEPGARLVLLDSAVVQAAVGPEEIGLDLIWQAAGDDEAETLSFEDRAGLPWPVAHLKASSGQLIWTRRGADLPESWALPEGGNTGSFALEADTGSGFSGESPVSEAYAAVPSGAVAVRVAAIGADGRYGPWVSIRLGTS